MSLISASECVPQHRSFAGRENEFLLIRVLKFFLEQLAVPNDGIHRCSQLMTHFSQECILRLILATLCVDQHSQLILHLGQISDWPATIRGFSGTAFSETGKRANSQPAGDPI